MKVFVTGGSGLLGTKIAEMALKSGHEVYSGYHHNRPEFGEPIKFDLAREGSARERVMEVEPEVIFHTATMTDVDRCEVERDLALRVNAQGTKDLAESARDIGSYLLYVSTDYVFDGSKGMYQEEDDVNPVNHYGYSKLLGEGHCEGFCIARTCVVYGSRPASGKLNFALWLIQKLERGEEVKVVVDQYVTPTLNTNLAEMILEVTERDMTGIYHLAGAERVSRYEFAKELAAVFDLDDQLIRPSKMSYMCWAARRPEDSSLDTAKADRVLQRKPCSLVEALKTLKAEVG